jgi:hypothetical protein
MAEMVRRTPKSLGAYHGELHRESHRKTVVPKIHQEELAQKYR